MNLPGECRECGEPVVLGASYRWLSRATLLPHVHLEVWSPGIAEEAEESAERARKGRAGAKA